MAKANFNDARAGIAPEKPIVEVNKTLVIKLNKCGMGIVDLSATVKRSNCLDKGDTVLVQLDGSYEGYSFQTNLKTLENISEFRENINQFLWKIIEVMTDEEKEIKKAQKNEEENK